MLSKRLRETLKEQMRQKDMLLKKLFASKSLEYKVVVETDRNAVEEDKKKKVDKFEYLKTYRDENKKVRLHNFSNRLFKLLIHY